MKYGHCITIDPGLGGTGVCCGIMAKRGLVIRHLKVFEAKNPKAPYLERALQIADDFGPWLADEVCLSSPMICLIEEPKIWMTSGKALASANRGDVLKLTTIFGALAHAAQQWVDKVEPLPIQRWKGQMPKKAVLNRIMKRFRAGRFELDSSIPTRDIEQLLSCDHVADALGMTLEYYNIL